MSQPQPLPAAPDSTHERVLDAAVACIASRGFQASNLARIAAEAGLTTGAIQHRFGDKATLLAEVVERGFERVLDRLARLPGSSLPPEQRVAAFVEAMWAGYEAESTRASLEILLAMRGDDAFRERSLAFVGQMGERFDRLWMGSFWELEAPRARHVEAQLTVFRTLNGLALERILLPGPQGAADALARLAATVMAILAPTA